MRLLHVYDCLLSIYYQQKTIITYHMHIDINTTSNSKSTYTYNDFAICLILSTLVEFTLYAVWKQSNESWILPSFLRIRPYKYKTTYTYCCWSQWTFLCLSRVPCSMKSVSDMNDSASYSGIIRGYMRAIIERRRSHTKKKERICSNKRFILMFIRIFLWLLCN